MTLLVADTLDALGVLYTIGSSLVSALHGVMRADLGVSDLLERVLAEAYAR